MSDEKKNGWFKWDGYQHLVLEYRVDGISILEIKWNKWVGCVSGKTRSGLKDEWKHVITDESGRPDVTYHGSNGKVDVPGTDDGTGHPIKMGIYSIYYKYFDNATIDEK